MLDLVSGHVSKVFNLPLCIKCERSHIVIVDRDVIALEIRDRPNRFVEMDGDLTEANHT
jgi:hypothetical protein